MGNSSRLSPAPAAYFDPWSLVRNFKERNASTLGFSSPYIYSSVPDERPLVYMKIIYPNMVKCWCKIARRCQVMFLYLDFVRRITSYVQTPILDLIWGLPHRDNLRPPTMKTPFMRHWGVRIEGGATGGCEGGIYRVGHEGSQPWLDCPRKFLKFMPSETTFTRFLSIKLASHKTPWKSKHCLG